MSTWLVTGATSEIAFRVCRENARGNRFVLLARSLQRLASLRADLLARGAEDVVVQVIDFAGLRSWQDCHHRLCTLHGAPDVYLVAQGMLLDSEDLELSPAQTREIFEVNSTSVAEIVIDADRVLQEKGRGMIVVLGSVAGDRARAANFAYGATKAVAAFVMAGLRLRNRNAGVRHLLISLGPVDTPMTRSRKQNGLYADAGRVAASISRLIGRGAAGRYYVPGFWWLIMLVIRLLPAWLLRRLPV